MRLKHLLWTASLLLLVQPGCRDESEPVDIPFRGVDVSADPLHGRGAPPPSASASASTAPKRPSHRVGKGGKAKRPSGTITGCCAALSAKVKKATNQGEGAMYGQAAAVCYRLSQQVEQGKLDRAKALAQVRSSLLGTAPAACR